MKTNLIKRLVTIAAAVTIALAIGAGGAHAGLKDNKGAPLGDGHLFGDVVYLFAC